MENSFGNALEQGQKKYTAEIPTLFRISSATMYNYFKDLYIETRRDKNDHTYIENKEFQLMEELVAYIKKHGKKKKDEFIKQLVESGRITPPKPELAQPEQPAPAIEPERLETAQPETEAIVVQDSEEIARSCQGQIATSLEFQQQPTAVEATRISPEVSQQELIASMQAAKGARVRASDLQEVHENARDRAYALEVTEEALVPIYRATENFTPEQKQQLEQYRAACAQANESRRAAHEVNDFLSEALSGLVG